LSTASLHPGFLRRIAIGCCVGLVLAAAGVLADPTAARSAALGEDLSDAQLVGAHSVVYFEGTSVTPALEAQIRGGEIAGVIVLDDVNFHSPGELRSLTRALQAVPRPRPFRHAPLIIATDQEGGEFQNVPGAPGLAPQEVGHMHSLRAVERLGEATGRTLRAAGVNLNFAPLVDIGLPGTFEYTSGRSLGTTPRSVILHAQAFIRGMHQVGIRSCIKHWAGLGLASAFEDDRANVIPHTLEQLRGIEEAPYRALRDQADMVMTSTGVYPPFGAEPALYNAGLMHELRHHVGFEGPTITDALRVDSLGSFDEVPRAVRAFRAGNDLVLADQSHVTEAVDALGSGELSRRQLLADLPMLRGFRESLVE
jgi:beta-N-acetylhexosaminidase